MIDLIKTYYNFHIFDIYDKLLIKVENNSYNENNNFKYIQTMSSFNINLGNDINIDNKSHNDIKINLISSQSINCLKYMKMSLINKPKRIDVGIILFKEHMLSKFN